MNVWELPTSLHVGGSDWKIRSDFRAILDILMFFNNPDYEPDERWEICLDILYEDYEGMPDSIKQEAYEKAIEFIDMGIKDDGKRKAHTMDWEQDAVVITPSVNRVLGYEVRAQKYIHWWTFLGAYMEIGESVFSQILSIRIKKSEGKKLEKWEQEFYRKNKEIIDLQHKYSEEEKAAKERLLAFLD